MSKHSVDTFATLLQAGEAHVWSVSPDAVFHSVEALSECLSPEDRARARLHAEGMLRSRFIITRSALRDVLARYVAASPATVPMRRESSGKLILDGRQDVHFSLTHSGPVALIAVAGAPVGVDAEHLRQPHRLEKTARRILHEETVRVLEALPVEERVRAFIGAWTLREAHVKAVGGGLFRTPDALPFDADSAADGSAFRVTSRLDGEAWSVARFTPTAAATASVVVRGTVSRVRFMTWNHPEHEDTNE